MRNWRRDTVTIAPPPVHEISTQKDKWDVELPWGMPKDSHLLPQHSQDLLRAARSGRLYVRRQAVEEEEVDAEAALGDKPEKKEEDPKEKGFSVKTWKLVPKHQEGPEIEFLAKRRKGPTGMAVKTAIISGSAMTKARVRRIDAAGNTYVEDVVVAEGQALDGELISQTVLADSVVGKSAVDAIPAVPIPPRRRPPPPKRKAKGPGRGRKRKLPQAPTSVPGEPGGVKLEAENEGIGVKNDSVASEVSSKTHFPSLLRIKSQTLNMYQGIKREDSDTVNNENEIEDTEMGDDNINPSDEEGEDGSDDDDQSEGEGQGDHDEDDIENSEANHPDLAPTEANQSADAADKHGIGQDRERDISSSPELPLATLGSTVGHEHGTAGSPLRNVVTFAPTFEERSPDVVSDGEAEAEGDEDENIHDNIHENLQGEVEDSDMQRGYNIPQDAGFSAEHAGGGMSMEQNQDYMDDDEMLLDGDMSGMDFGTMSADHEPYPVPYPEEEEEIMPVPLQEEQDRLPPDQQTLDQEPHFSAHDIVADQLVLVSPEGAREDEEDNFEDLLGSLEDHLNEQGSGPEAEQAEENADLEDEVAHIPAPDQSEARPTALEIGEDSATCPTQDEVPDEKPAMEVNVVNVDAGVEVREAQGEEAEAPAPEPVGDE